MKTDEKKVREVKKNELMEIFNQLKHKINEFDEEDKISAYVMIGDLEEEKVRGFLLGKTSDISNCMISHAMDNRPLSVVIIESAKVLKELKAALHLLEKLL